MNTEIVKWTAPPTPVWTGQVSGSLVPTHSGAREGRSYHDEPDYIEAVYSPAKRSLKPAADSAVDAESAAPSASPLSATRPTHLTATEKALALYTSIFNATAQPAVSFYISV